MPPSETLPTASSDAPRRDRASWRASESYDAAGNLYERRAHERPPWARAGDAGYREHGDARPHWRRSRSQWITLAEAVRASGVPRSMLLRAVEAGQVAVWQRKSGLAPGWRYVSVSGLKAWLRGPQLRARGREPRASGS